MNLPKKNRKQIENKIKSKKTNIIVSKISAIDQEDYAEAEHMIRDAERGLKMLTYRWLTSFFLIR